MTAAGDVLGGKYQLLRLLGEGGMGQVFEAVNQNTDRRVAIKTLHAQWTREPTVVQRFLREARAATKIHHSNVVDVLDLDTDAATGAPYIVQEFLAGESLQGHLDARPDKRLSVEESLRIVVPVMEALVAAHELGIVHRDLKPANLFLALDRNGVAVPKVIDFGIAKLMETKSDAPSQTMTGTLIGTPDYMSPEQASGASDLDARTDVWSLGVVLYEMLTGALPYEAPNYNLLVAKIVYEPPRPVLQCVPTLPADLAAVVDRALQKDRALRFLSMQAMLDATHACEAAAPLAAARGSAPPPRVSIPSAAPTIASPSSSPSLVAWSAPPARPPRRSAAITALAVVAAALFAVAGMVSFRPRPVTVLATPTRARLPPPATPTSDPFPTPIAMPSSAPSPPVAEVVPSVPPVAPVAVPSAVRPVAPPATTDPIAAPTPRPAADPPIALYPAAPARTRRPAVRRPPPVRLTRPANRDFDRGYPE